ncbi:unnamed protein product [Rotaria sordida]|uniref:Late endosomal/lysosomal adaptor and MAPK and MTOR activator 4 n=1 Tax=Rotaria sordida TaxID=392033 RepID=A0A815ULC5_9BILA|nr:unnamed protein product [Rotaria sordida]CAF1662430.1 unnamed protein product [Rotaria sordida]
MKSLVKVFDNVSDCVGYLIMNEDGSIEHNHGDLQNNENAANLIYKMIFFSNDHYVDCISCANHRIYVAKRRKESSTIA